MLFRLLYDDMLAHGAYLIGCQRTGEAIMIDPPRDIDRCLRAAAAHGMRIAAIAETHIHADFLSGARQLAVATGAPVYVSGEGGDDWQYGWLNDDTTPVHGVALRHGDSFMVGGIRFEAMHTPGHTPEHLCYAVTDVGGGATEPMGILTGDFVFVGDVGRPDLLESAAGVAGARDEGARELQASALRFLDLPDHFQVWPAHGAGSACGKALGAVPQSTVGYERRTNGALQLAPDADAFVQDVLAGQHEPPLYFGRMKQLNRDGVPLLDALPAPAQLDADALVAVDTAATAVLDLRRWQDFRDGHLPGSLYLVRGPMMLAAAGSFVQPQEPVVLICEAHEVDAITRALVRIGLDNVVGWADAATMHAALQQRSATTREISVGEVASAMADASLLDVRSTAEHEAASIDGGMLVPHTRLLERMDQVPDGDLLVLCAGGVRSAMACSLLERAGYTVTNIAGGMHAYQRHLQHAGT